MDMTKIMVTELPILRFFGTEIENKKEYKKINPSYILDRKG